MELKQYFELVRRWLWLLVLGALVGSGSAYATSRLQVPEYEATARVLISEAPSMVAGSDVVTGLGTERLSGTMLQLMTSRPVLEEVIARLGLASTPGELAQSLSVELVGSTRLIEIRATGTDPRLTAAIANTVPEVFQEYNEAQQASRYAESKANLQEEIAVLDGLIAETQAEIDALGTPEDVLGQSHLDRLQSEITLLRQSRTGLLQSLETVRLAESQSQTDILLIEPAETPFRPVRPRTVQNTALAAIVGLMLAGGIAFLIEYLDDTLKAPHQVTALLGVPVVGVLAKLPRKQLEGGPIAHREPRSPTTEAFRGLRTNLQFAGVDKPLRRLLVTSVGAGEGKSTVVANLAVVMAQAGHQVAIVDADLRRPEQHRLHGKANRVGLSDTLVQEHLYLNGSLQTAEVKNLSIMTTGALPPNPAELLGSQKMASLMALLDDHAERLIVDSPPISAVTDAVVLANQVDGVILVVEAGKTRAGPALQVKEQLDRVGANLVGVVLNKVPIGRDGYYYSHYYYYYSAYGEDGQRQPRRRLFGRLFRRRHHAHSANGRPQREAAPVTPHGAQPPEHQAE